MHPILSDCCLLVGFNWGNGSERGSDPDLGQAWSSKRVELMIWGFSGVRKDRNTLESHMLFDQLLKTTLKRNTSKSQLLYIQ